MEEHLLIPVLCLHKDKTRNTVEKSFKCLQAAEERYCHIPMGAKLKEVSGKRIPEKLDENNMKNSSF
jgi:hypothetical protein